jgi:two-component system, OmpR family, response regulator
MKVLVVEDEEKICSFIRKGLEAHGMVCDVFRDGEEGYLAASTQSYDALILDIMVPGRDGLSILKSLRQKSINTPVILVTARGGLDDRLEGLNLGADDYLTKPFYVDELIARLHAVCRRTTGAQLNLRQCANLVLNLATREVRRGEEAIELTPREFNLLEFLMRHPGRVYTRIQILEHVWNYDFDPGSNLVDVYIQRVRRKLRGDEETEADLIETVRGVGYRMREG